MSPRALAIAVQDASGAAGVPSAARLKRWAEAALGARARGELTIRVVAEQESAALNRRYRGKRGSTNVLAFPYDDGVRTRRGEPPPLGDLVICAAVVAREALEQRKPLDAHWAHMVVHGVLHLRGFEHDDEAHAAAMERRERKLLAALGYGDPYAVPD